MDVDRIYKSTMRVNRSLQTLNFLETTLNVPSISVISTPYVTRLSRKDLQKIIQVPVSDIPTIHQYQNMRNGTRNNNWYNNSQFKIGQSNGSFQRPSTDISSKKNISGLKRICTQYSYVQLFLFPLVLAILGALIIALTIVFTEMPITTSTTTTTTTVTTLTTTTTVTTSTTTTTTTVTTTTTSAVPCACNTDCTYIGVNHYHCIGCGYSGNGVHGGTAYDCSTSVSASTTICYYNGTINYATYCSLGLCTTGTNNGGYALCV